MKTVFLYSTILLAGALSLSVAVAQTQSQDRNGPPPLPTGVIAAELGVSETAFVDCLGPRPERGQRPPRPDAGKIAACLQTAGLGAEDVAAALKAHAPNRRP